MTVLVVGVAAPTPGGVGAFHAAYQFAVTTFFARPSIARSGAAIVLHAVSFVPVTLLGLVFMAREGLTFAERQADRRLDGKARVPEPAATSGRRATVPRADAGATGRAGLEKGAR